MSAWEWYNPWYLLLLPVFVLMCILAWRRPRPSLKFTATDNLVSLQRPVRQRLPIILMLMGILLFILALARPREVNVQRFKSSSGIDIMIAIDLSGSMAAVDLPVDAQLADFREALLKDEMKDRLDVAKEEIDRFIFKRPSDRMGLIAFSGQSYTACPPTLDHNFLREHLKQLQHGILNEDSTALAPPILTAVNQLKASPARERLLMLFTDGKNMRQTKVSPLQAAQVAESYQIRIFTVAMGSDNAYFIQGKRLEKMQNQHDPELLKKIASISGGSFLEARDRDAMAAALDSIDKMVKTEFKQKTFHEYKELFPFLLIAGGIVLLAGIILQFSLFLDFP